MTEAGAKYAWIEKLKSIGVVTLSVALDWILVGILCFVVQVHANVHFLLRRDDKAVLI